MAGRGLTHLASAVLTIMLAASAGCDRSGPKNHDSTGAVNESRARHPYDAGNNTSEENKELARYLIRENYPEWNGSGQLQCLDNLWQKESHWNHRAVNKRTGACGIPQSYPCNKMVKWGETYGVDYRRNPWPQIAWGLQYIEKRYRTPCAAWKRFQRGGGY